MYVADEDTEPVLLYDRMPMTANLNVATEANRGALWDFWVEYNTSTSTADQGRALQGFADLISYVRGLAVLKNPTGVDPTNQASWSALRVKPVR